MRLRDVRCIGHLGSIKKLPSNVAKPAVYTACFRCSSLSLLHVVLFPGEVAATLEDIVEVKICFIAS